MSLQRQTLTAAHVKYIVLHKPQQKLFQWTGKDGDFAAYLRVYPTVQAAEDMTVLRVY